MKKNQHISLEVPEIFPKERYDKLTKIKHSFFTKDDLVKTEFSGGWNAILIRFLSCYESSQNYINSINTYGDSPPQPHRYYQEKELFNFFTNGLSVIECFYYAVFAIGSNIDPVNFPMNNEIDLKKIIPSVTKDKYNKRFPLESITVLLDKLIGSQEYIKWKDIRNTLCHRLTPPRLFFEGNSDNKPAMWQKFQVNLDETTTNDRVRWLANINDNLFEELHEFIKKHVKHEIQES